MLLTQPMFVLQRRINQPLGAVERVLCDPRLLRAGATHELSGGASLHIERPFGVAFPPFGVDFASWSAPARVYTGRSLRPVKFELEINAWDNATTELLVRPRAHSPYRWSGRRMRRYFEVGHATADGMTQLLRSRAVSPAPARFATSGSAPR
jgi:hypothetical protein